MNRISLITLLCMLVPAEITSAKEGFYFGLGVGGTMVSGESAIALKNPNRDPDYDLNRLGAASNIHLNCTPPDCPPTDHRKLVTTEVGSGVAFDFRLGYNILGFVALEFNVMAGGNNLGDSDKLEGHGGLFGLIKFFPAQLFRKVQDRWWDPYVMVGGGGYFMAYQPVVHQGPPKEEMNTDGRGWYPSSAVKYGFGCDFYAGPFLSLGIDLAFLNGFHDTFMINNTDDISSQTVETASSFAFHPSFKLTFHFMGN